MYHEFLMPYVKLTSNVNKHLHIPGVPELPHDILITYSGVKIKTKFERINVEGRRVFKW
jgi:hypothetical protein